MFKLMSAVLSLKIGSAATITDSTGATVEIEDQLDSIYSFPSSESDFDNHWYIVDDQIMGGKSQSYVEYENTYGKFYGTANSDGGGFSSVRTTDYSQSSWKRFEDMETIADLSQYDGIVLDVAS